MAYNPFRAFRKHQKVLMAGMVLVAMVTFVLTGSLTGRGDFFDWFASIFTGRVSKNVVITVNGQDVDILKLREVSQHRQIANQFMMLATEDVLSKKPELSPTAQQYIIGPYELRKLIGQFFGPQPYFGGALQGERIADFLMWEHQAEQLGITLTEDDIKKEVAYLTLGKLTGTDSAAIERYLRQNFRGMNKQVLVSSIGDEVRVQLAQKALLGDQPDMPNLLAAAAMFGDDPNRQSSIPAPITPWSFWEYFKDNRTGIDVVLLPVQVEDFLAQVKEKPTEEQLKELYDKYKTREYNPESSEPGFMKPRQVQVQWVAGQWRSPYYLKAAGEHMQLLRASMMFLAGTDNRLGLCGLAPAAEAGLWSVDPMLVAEYDRMKKDKFTAPSWFKSWGKSGLLADRVGPLHESSMLQPSHIAGAVGQALGLAGTGSGATALSALADFTGSGTARELEKRLKLTADLVLAGAIPTPLQAAAAAYTLAPKADYLPLEQVKGEVQNQMLEFQASELLRHNLDLLRKKIEEAPKTPDRKDLDEYLAKAVKDYDLQIGKTTGPRDEFRNKIIDDPGIKPLKDAYLRPPSMDPTARNFSKLFFNDKKPFQVETFAPSPWEPEYFLYWKTESQAAKVADFNDPAVRKEVENAWRFQKARELAKKAADDLAAKVKEQKGDIRKLEDFALSQKKDLIKIPRPLAMMLPRKSISPEMANTYRGPRLRASSPAEPADIPEDKISYPTNDFAIKILALRDKPVGETVVVPNQPEATFYVTALINKTDPSQQEFFEAYQRASAQSKPRDPLFSMFLRDRQQRYRDDILEEMKKAAKLQVHSDNLKANSGSGGAGD